MGIVKALLMPRPLRQIHENGDYRSDYRANPKDSRSDLGQRITLAYSFSMVILKSAYAGFFILA